MNEIFLFDESTVSHDIKIFFSEFTNFKLCDSITDTTAH